VVKKITKPFVFLEISTTKGYAHNSEADDGDTLRVDKKKSTRKKS
jgi:hypothetical protein